MLPLYVFKCKQMVCTDLSVHSSEMSVMQLLYLTQFDTCFLGEFAGSSNEAYCSEYLASMRSSDYLHFLGYFKIFS